MRKLIMIVIAALALTSCTKEVEVEKIVYVDKVIEDLEKVNELQAQVNQLQSQLDSSNSSNSNLESQILSLQSEIDELNFQLNSALNSLNTSEEEIKLLEEEIESLELEVSELESEISGLEIEISELEENQLEQVQFNPKWDGPSAVFSGDKIVMNFTIPTELNGGVLLKAVTLIRVDEDGGHDDTLNFSIFKHGDFHSTVSVNSGTVWEITYYLKTIIDGIEYVSIPKVVKIYGK